MIQQQFTPIGPHGNFDCAACSTQRSFDEHVRFRSDLHAKMAPHQGNGLDPVITAYWVECAVCHQKGPEFTDILTNARGKAVHAWNELQFELYDKWQWANLR